MQAVASTLRGWVRGPVALELASASPDDAARLAELRRRLTLQQRTWEGDRLATYAHEQDGWLLVPRGTLLDPDLAALLPASRLWDGRSDGQPLPAGAHVAGVTFGAPPFPAGQPAFIDEIVEGCRSNRYGGLGIAPTRSGKTLLSIEAACRLGGATLVLVDREPLLRQWREAIVGAPDRPDGPRVLDGAGRPVACGILRAEEAPTAEPFCVAMAQTIARRALPEAFRRAFRTVIVDEVQSVPCETLAGALARLEHRYTLGLTATPRRADGLDAAIGWLAGPVLATLARQLVADVHFLHVPYRGAEIVKPIRDEAGVPTGETRLGRARLTRFGDFDGVQAEKALTADRQRVALVVDEACRAAAAGRQVLVLVGLRDHLGALAAGCRARGQEPGTFWGGQTDAAEMRHPVVLATYGAASRGIDFQPPPTLLVLAAPRSDVQQAVGRVLQPQAPCRPLVVDLVDGAAPFRKLACRRQAFYRRAGFRLLNAVEEAA